MAEAASETLGEYLLCRHRKGETTRLKRARLYADRDLVEAEFARIWETQESHHPQLQATENGRSLRDRFHEEVFRQLPLRSPAPLVGHCALEPSLPRSPMAQPAAQAFRIEKQLADLAWVRGRDSESLTQPQRDTIRGLLIAKEEVTFEQIYKALKKADCPPPPGRWLNLSRGGRERLTGDRTTAAFRRLGLLEEWLGLEAIDQLRVINLLADMGSPEVFDQAGWEGRLVSKDNKPRSLAVPVVDFVNRMVASGKFGRLSAMKFDSGRSAYSVKALRTLTALMRDRGLDERHAVDAAYPHANDAPPSILSDLPAHDATGNVVVDVALRQLCHEVNKAIHHLGEPPAEVIVELSRDMRLGLAKRGEVTKRIRRNERARRDARKAIEDHGGTATGTAIRRYLLWTEQDQEWCPYCDRPINLGAALADGQTHFEHILPRALTRIGKQRDYQVLAHNSCNDDKGDHTPWEAWGDGRDTERWMIVETRAERFVQKRLYGKARQLLAMDFESEVLDDDAIAGFSERQFQEGAWIARLAAQWLRQVCPNVAVSRGILTAHLRRVWGLETVIPHTRLADGLPIFDRDGTEISQTDFDRYRSYWEGHPAAERTDRRLDKRVDHRHHLIDALVIGLTTRSLYQRMARHYQQVTESGDGKMRLYAEPPLPDIRKHALEVVEHCNLTHKSDRYPAGPMFKENALAVVLGKDGQRYFAQRKELTALAGPRDSVDTVRKRIETIVSDLTREAVGRAFENRLASGKSAVEALTEEIAHPVNGTTIRRVLMRGDKEEGAVKVTHDNRRSRALGQPLYKHLAPDGYAWLEINPEKPKDQQIRLVRPHEVNRETGQRMNGNPRRFYKSDTVRDPKDGHLFVVRQIKAGPRLILTLITETATAKESRDPRKREVCGDQILRLEVIHHG
ncbi:MAG TPA: HNH endonuclease domain-containing protein [Gemmatimonadales bacterium]